MKPSFFATSTSLVLLATSLMVHAQAPPPPGPPPTPFCAAEELSVSLPGRSQPYKFWVPKTDENNSAPNPRPKCTDVPILNGARYFGGNIWANCETTGFVVKKTDWENPQHACLKDEINLDCDITAPTIGISRTELEQAYAEMGDKVTGKVVLKELPSNDNSQGNIAKVSVRCGSSYESDKKDADAEGEGAFSANVPNCNSVDDGICYLDPYKAVKSSTTPSAPNAFSFFTKQAKQTILTDKNNKAISGTVVYLWNKSATTQNIPSGALRFNYRKKDGGSWSSYDNKNMASNDLPGVAAEATACDLRVSGATSEYLNTVPPSVSVGNDVLIFTVNLKGGSGNASIPPKITFSGGPNPVTGVWTSPPVDSEATVRADVVTGVSKTKFFCQLKIDTSSKKTFVKLRRFGDCSYFDALRDHYFRDATGRPLSGGYGTKNFLTMPGIDAKYGIYQAEVPFMGVLDAAASTGGEIVVNSAGKVVIPPIDKRRFSKAVIVGKRFRNGSQVQDPVFYGTMDLNDYSRTYIYQVDPTITLDPEDSVVFQAYLAATQPDASLTRDLRGTAQGLPFYSFAPSTESGQPYDRIIPFTNESCVPLFQATPPLRSGLQKPAELMNASQCLYSRPFKIGDVLNQRAELTIMHLVPLHYHHQFPTELLKASSQPTCVANNPTATAYCWDIKAASMGSAATADPFASHLACRSETTTWTTQTASSTTTQCRASGGNSGGQICTKKTTKTSTPVPITTVNYNASCPVLEKKSECSANVAIRFSGYNQMMIAGLMCAAKYDQLGQATAGDQVTATIRGGGILPYTPALGGSAPKAFEDYPGAYGQTKGVGCAPCRFGSDAAKSGLSLESITNGFHETQVLPVDQDSSSARKPIFSFRKMKAPKECIRNVNFEVRYFGSAECTGVNAPPGHFCTSSNLGGQVCNARDGHGSGNVAASMSIPVCPNSGFEYDNVSVSWSPLLLDIGGNGISISREMEHALKFDIRGDGKQRLVDWPINAKEVAFLVLPNKNGKVESGKELFGDAKASNGFEALAKYDSNKDKKINRDDKIYSQLRLWFDRNRNGVYDEGEGALLKDHGVETIYLEHRKMTNRGTDGKTLSSVYYNDKWREYLNIGDYYFNEYPTPKAAKGK